MSNPNQIDQYAVQSAAFQAMDSRIDAATAEDAGMSTPDNVARHYAAGQEVARLLAEARVTQGVHPTDQLFHDESLSAAEASREENRLRMGLGYGAEGYTPATPAQSDTVHANRARADKIIAEVIKLQES